MPLLTREARFEETRCQVLGKLNPDNSRSQAKDVHIVVLHSLGGRSRCHGTGTLESQGSC